MHVPGEFTQTRHGHEKSDIGYAGHFGQRRKGREWALDFRSGESQVVEEDRNPHGRTILAGWLRNDGTRGLAS